MSRDPELDRLGQELEVQRPVPHPSFRGELRRGLLASSGAARRRARTLVFAYGASGLVLIAVAVAGIAGAGPFAAG